MRTQAGSEAARALSSLCSLRGGVQICADDTLTYCDAELTKTNDPAIKTQYCAYHSGFYVGNTPTLYSNMFDAGYSTACGGPNWDINGQHYPPIGGNGPNGDAVADHEISHMSHELAETTTDPLPNSGWVDSKDGYEIGDICAYIYGPLTDGGDVVLHGHRYLVQQLWNNSASTCVLSFARPTILPVNTKTDSVVGGTTPLCPNTAGGDKGSTYLYPLRCAIGDADNDALAGFTGHTINFVHCASPCAVTLQSTLSPLTAPGLTIDGGVKASISGNHRVGSGLSITSSHISVKGLTVDFVKENAVYVDGNVAGVTMGGAEPDILKNNSGWGVIVGSSARDNSDAVISKNVISGNPSGGISLSGLAVSHCASPGTGGPNGYLACPRITSALPGSVRGTSTCKNGCRVEVFAVPSTPDASHHGQAGGFVGSGTTTATGTWSISPAKALGTSEKLTATVTNTVTGHTSEFAANISVT